MTQPHKTRSSWVSVLPSLVVPVCLGMTLYIGLLALIRQDIIENQTVLRYLTGHPVSNVTVAMFLIGGASLCLIAFNILSQFASERQIRLRQLVDADSQDPSAIDDTEKAIELGRQLLDYPTSVQGHYLWQRLKNALHYVYRNGSASGVDDEIKYLSELDLDRQQQRYSLVRILIWATPMLGFLGTVLGISQALGGISVGPDNDFQQMMDGLQSSLYVAFDTTALALTLSMILMFAQFLVDRFETQLLTIVDQRARSEIASQYDLGGGGTDAGGSVERLGQHMLDATREMVVAQTDIWKKSIRSAEKAWSASLGQTNEQVRISLSESIEKTVGNFSRCLDGSIQKADNSMARRWEQWQVLLSDNARLMSTHQQELLQQTRSIETLAASSGNELQVQASLQKTTEAIAATAELKSTIEQLTERVAAMRAHEKSEARPVVAFTSLAAASESHVPAESVDESPDEESQADDERLPEVMITRRFEHPSEMPARSVTAGKSQAEVVLPIGSLPSQPPLYKKAA